MSRLAPLVLLLVPALVSCGSDSDRGTDPTGGTDAGAEQGLDGGATDAGTDAGTSSGNPNDGARGTWTMSGTAQSGCGMILNSGLGAPHPGTTHEFTLTPSNQFNGQPVIFRCELATGSTKFTCTDYLVGMSFSGCVVSGGMRAISGHLNGTNVDLVGTVHSAGQGSCPPTVNCGPKELSVSGTVAP